MNKMNFDEFKNVIVDGVRAAMPTEYDCASYELNEVRKNNGIVLTGLNIKRTDRNVCPNVYLNGYYNMYQDGADIDVIISKIVAVYLDADLGKDFDISLIADFENCKGRIVPKLINFERNIQYLDDKAFMRIEDLAVVYVILFDQKVEDGVMSVTITNSLLDKWNISVDALHDIAIKNLPEVMPGSVKGMGEVLAEMMGDDSLAEMFPADELMYVITNKAKVNGAAAILDDSLMKATFNNLGRFFVIPSSIHEAIIIPIRKEMSISDIEDMIHQVNATELKDEDILSDSLYIYDPILGFKIASDELLQATA